MSNTLTYFPVDGYWFSVDAPSPRSSASTPQLLPVFGLVDLIPRLPSGFLFRIDQFDQGNGTVADTDVAIPARTGRIWNGRLCSINVNDSPTVDLVANTAALGITPELLPDTSGNLIYDVRFRDVTYNGVPQHISSFGFLAATTATAILLTDNTLERLPYGGPTERSGALVQQSGVSVAPSRHLSLVQAKEMGVA